MTREGSFLLMIFFAVIVLFSSVGRAQEASVSQAIQKPSAESLVPEIDTENVVPETDVCLEEKPMTLEKLKSIFGAHRVCNVACYSGWVNCTEACGMSASCYDGYCLYL